jgi:hypothetical protein
MPRSPKYPLGPLLQHRERKVDDATSDLGEAVRAREAAEEAKLGAERERCEAESRAAEEREAEAVRLASGELRVADLAHAQQWELGVSHAIADLSRVEGQADDRARLAREGEEQARSELAKQKADRDVVAKDRSRFSDKLRKSVDAAEEENAEEAHAARRGRP